MTVDQNNPKHLIADEGMVLKRVVGSTLIGKEIFLGQIKLNGTLVEDVKENYKEVTEDSVKPKDKKNKSNEEEA